MTSDGVQCCVDIVEQLEDEIEATDVEDLPHEGGEPRDHDAALLPLYLTRCHHEDTQPDATDVIYAAHIDDDRTGFAATLVEMRLQARAKGVGTGMIDTPNGGEDNAGAVFRDVEIHDARARVPMFDYTDAVGDSERIEKDRLAPADRLSAVRPVIEFGAIRVISRAARKPCETAWGRRTLSAFPNWLSLVCATIRSVPYERGPRQMVVRSHRPLCVRNFSPIHGK